MVLVIDFSVINGAMITSRASMLRADLLEMSVRRSGENQALVGDDRLDLQIAHGKDADARYVGAGADEVPPHGVGFAHVVDEERLRAGFGGLGRAEERRRELFGLGHLERGRLEHEDGVVGEAVGKRRFQRHLPLLLIERLLVRSRLRPEDDAAMTPLRRANGSLTSAAGALLTPGLLAAAGNFVAT